MLARHEILGKLADYLHELFEIPREKVVSEATLFGDLDLDSIDAVDLIVKIQDLTGRRIEPGDFKTVRTVGDVVTCVEHLLADAPVAR